MTRAQQLVEHLLEGDDVKDWLMAQDSELFPDTFTVYSSGGEITADVHTGRVAKVELYPPYRHATPYGEEPEPDEDYSSLHQIDRFDVEDYNRWLAEVEPRPLAKGDTVDIVDIGYWLYNGHYEPAVDEQRQIARGDRDPD